MDFPDVRAEVLRARSRIGIASHTKGQKEVRRVLPLDSRADRKLVGLINHDQVFSSVVAELEARDSEVECVVVVSDVDETAVRETRMQADVQQPTENATRPGLWEAPNCGHATAHVVIERASAIGEEEVSLADDRNSIGDPVARGEHPRLVRFTVSSRIVRLAGPKQERQGQKAQASAAEL